MRIAGIVLYVLICCLAGIHGGPTDLSGYSITPHYGKSGEWEGYDIAKKDAGELLCKDDFLRLLQSRFHLG